VQHGAKNGWNAWTAYRNGATGGNGGGQPNGGGGGKGRSASGKMPTNVNTGESFKDVGDFLTSKQFILPALQGLGAMASSPSRYLGSAILQGVGAGAKAYQNFEPEQANLAQTRASTEATRAGTQSVLTSNVQKSLGYVNGIGPVVWYTNPKTGKVSFMRQPEYEQRTRNGEQFDLLNAADVQSGMAQTPYTRTGELNPEVTKKIEESKAIPAATPTVPKVPDVISGATYTDISRKAAQNDIAGSSGNYDRDKEFAAKRLAEIQAEADAARKTSPYTNKLGNTLISVNQEGGLTGPGFAFNTRAGYASFLNYVARALGSSENFSESDFSNAEKARDVARKIAVMQGDARARSANQNSYSALNDFASITPNPEMAPRAAAEILSQIMADQKKARDIESHALQYRKDAVGGGFNNQARAFEQEEGHRQEDYIQQQKQIEKMVLASLDPKNKGKKSAFNLLSSGQVPINQAQKELQQKGYDPRLVGYFYSGRGQ
jgi:hypothetical protein